MTTNPDVAARARVPGPDKPRVLVLLPDLAASHDSAIRTELASLEQDHEVSVLTYFAASGEGLGEAAEREQILAAIATFAPEVLHAHGLALLGPVGRLAEATGLPFTVRLHPRDTAPLHPRRVGERMMQVIRREPSPLRSAWLLEARRAMASALCLGVLAPPFLRPWLVRAGLPEAKLVDCFPAIRFADFHDRTPNGDAVMHVAAAAPRGGTLPDILRLAAKVPDRAFHLYAPAEIAAALGTRTVEVPTRASVLRSPGTAALPGTYKKHRWLVLTADASPGHADWPLAIAEAQASGVGVCMPALRPDLVRYVGEGAGILYGTIDELPAIVSAPVPEEMRERGFLQARKSDIAGHRHLLTDLWEATLWSGAAERSLTAEPAGAPRHLSSPPPARTGEAGIASAA